MMWLLGLDWLDYRGYSGDKLRWMDWSKWQKFLTWGFYYEIPIIYRSLSSKGRNLFADHRSHTIGTYSLPNTSP